jgi:phosphoribosylformylglycinamidine synthase
MEIWCNESQERYVLAIAEESIEMFSNFCLRERCPFSIVGEITKGSLLEVYDEHFNNYPISLSLDILFGKPPKSSRSFSFKKKEFSKLKIPDNDLESLLFKVLRHPTVASKNFLISIGDRTVTGLISRDQLVGPWQVPVSDYAMTRSGFSGASGEAMSIGERTPTAIINPAAAARISVAEAVTNILPSGISKLSDIKLSANWMGSPEKLDGNQDLYEAVEAIGMGLCPKWEIAIPVGKDSLSMSTEWEDKGKNKSVTSPLSLIISAFTAIKDINLAVTPQLIDKESKLIFIDLSKGSRRLGSSIASQVSSLFGGDVPDVECIKEMPNFVNTIHCLLKDKKILSYHDRSDGGLITTSIEMAFAGRLGVDIKLDLLPSNAEDVLADLFNEELGVVIQVTKEDEELVMRALDSCSLKEHSYAFGVLNKDKDIKLISNNKIIHQWPLKVLLKEWHKVSYEIQSLRDNPETAKSEYLYDIDSEREGIKPSLSFKIPSTFSISKTKPSLAILREQGINGQVEMAAAFDRVGFDCIDVHMTDLISGDSRLDEFQGLVACGGFSYGDVLGAGGGWATNILYNLALRDQFQEFFSNEEVFSLGICNGCQTISLLSSLIPGTEAWPKFKRNNSEKFEARLSQVLIQESPSIFFKDMAGSIMPIPVAHGEGRAELSEEDFSELILGNLNTMVYSDDQGKSTESYPENPNGSPSGIAGVTNKSGRVTIMMPHPERAFLTSQYSWHPKDWEEYGPWIKFFNNAKDFVS